MRLNDNLVLGTCLLETVQHLADNLHGSADRHGDHNQVGPVDASLQRNNLIRQTDGHRGRSRHPIRLDAENLLCKSPAFQVYCHGPTDEAQTNYSYNHLIPI